MSRQRWIDALCWIALFPLGAIVVCFLAWPALAQEAGTGIICDEQEQVEKYAKLATDQNHNAEVLNEVNGDTNACAIVQVVYLRGPTVSQVQNPQGEFDVVEITVIGANLGQGFLPTPPFKQFTLFKKEGQPT